MGDYSSIAALLLLLVIGALADSHCPFNHAEESVESEPSVRTKRNSSVRLDIDALLKSYLGKYNAVESVNHHQSSEPVRCGIPPANCLNYSQNLYYRSADGSCNNLLYPDYGLATSRYGRLLRPSYGDQVYAPGVAPSGGVLPNSRVLSLWLYGEDTQVDKYRTMAVMQWGQFVAHDISQLTTQGAPKDCCAEPGHKLCYPIQLPNAGPVGYSAAKSCLNFKRSISDADAICPKSRGPYSEKLSVVTAYLDLSSVYGSTHQQNQKVRLYKGGLLRTSYANNQHWLPIKSNFDGDCGDTHSECYSVPDKRNRFTPTIALLHTVLLREHNRLAEQLSLLNPHYSDERLYQEARKINIAQFQKITYYDWLPLLVGRSFAHLNGLIYEDDYVNDYDESVNAGPIAEFATAAFRYGHTQIPGWFSLVAPNRYANQTLRLSDHFGRGDINRLLSSGDNFDALLRGLATQLQKRSDANIDRELKHYFQRKEFEEFGSDLKALDIQRGRDFGLPSYNDVRELCGLRRATVWTDFGAEISSEKILNLSKLYASPEDVELTVGGSLEFHVPDALLGPTFLCIVSKQFVNTRRGDRFFFERENNLSGFSRVQLAEIRKASAASLFCNNGQYLQYIQADVFIFPNIRNVLLNCNDIAQVDLSKWQDVRPELVQ